ncbi:SLAM family member 9-like isoform X2 [Ranitomeya imitator]
MYRAIGSSVTFPPVKISNDIVYDLRKLSHVLIVTYHGSENVRPPYTHRVHFSSRTGEIEMRNLTEGDSGTYEQVVNLKVVAVIHLLVIEPVNEPTLRKVNETIHGAQCHVLLECSVQGSGPLNVTLLRDGREITENITIIDRSRYLSVDFWDPGFRGSYTCKSSNPLGAKTSAEITVLAPDEICKKATSDLYNWSFIIFIVIFIIIIAVIAIVLGLVLGYKKCRTSRGHEIGHDSGESADVMPEDTSESGLPLLNKTLENGRTPPCDVRTNDDRGPEEDENHDSLVEPPPEDFPSCPEPGQCGSEGASSMDPELSRASSDQEAVS